MAPNKHSGGARNGGYGSRGSGFGVGGRFNNSVDYRGGPGSVNHWQTRSVSNGPLPRQTQQGGRPSRTLEKDRNLLNKLSTSSNSMHGRGYVGGLNRGGKRESSGLRMSHMGMVRRKYGQGGFNKDNSDNRRHDGGVPHNRFSGGGHKSVSGIERKDKRKLEGKVNVENKKGQNHSERTKEQLDADKKVSYDGISSAVLYCHVCSIHMWDSESFEKHVCGTPHKLMMTNLDEEYKMRADLMIHKIKAVENQRNIVLKRVTNNENNKNAVGNSASKQLCTMCNVHVNKLFKHRKSEGHMKLKQFLHPECKLCNVPFYTPLQMDKHKLTAGHLKKLSQLRKVEHPHLKDDEYDLIDMIKIKEAEHQYHSQMPVAQKHEMIGDRYASKSKIELEGGSEEKPHYGENKLGTSNENQLEAYVPNVTIGKECLIPSKGFVCRLCHCFLLDELSVSIHCQTEAHHSKYYITMAKIKKATLVSKKRGIDQVIEKDANDKLDSVQIKEDNYSESSNALFEHFGIELELDRNIKRTRLEIKEIIEEINKSEPQLNTGVKNGENSDIGDKPEKSVEPSTLVAPVLKHSFPVTTANRGHGDRDRIARGVDMVTEIVVQEE